MDNGVLLRLECIETQLKQLTKILEVIVRERIDERHLNERFEESLQAIAADASLMAKHVGFVEAVYDKVQRPFLWLMGTIDRKAIVHYPRGGLKDSAPNTTRPSTSISS